MSKVKVDLIEPQAGTAVSIPLQADPTDVGAPAGTLAKKLADIGEGSAAIDDAQTAPDKTWSSEKISQEVSNMLQVTDNYLEMPAVISESKTVTTRALSIAPEIAPGVTVSVGPGAVWAVVGSIIQS